MRNRFKSIAVALVAGGSMLVLAGCTGGGPADNGNGSLEDMEPITLTIAEQAAEQQPFIPGLFSGGRFFINYIKERVGDKVVFEEYWAGSLFPSTESMTNLEAGVADVAYWSTAQTPNDLPISNWYQQLGSQGDPSLVFGAAQRAGSTYEMHMKNPTLIAEFADHNAMVIRATVDPRAGMLCKDEVTTLEDAQGKRARIGGPVWAPEMEALGMSPQFTPLAEVYEGFQRGVLDCITFPPSAFISLSLVEIGKHYNDLPLTTFIASIRAVNLDTWNSFPAELQQIFLEAGALESAAILSQNFEINAQIVQRAEELDIAIDDVSALLPPLLAKQSEVVAAMPDNAPAGVADPQSVIDDYLGYLDKWFDIVEETTPFEPGAQSGIAYYAENLPTDYAWYDDYSAKFVEIANEVFEAQQ